MAESVTDGFVHFDLAAMPKADGYKLLASVILPRPIAWVLSQDDAGALNAAPFSFFNILSADPPIVGIGFSAAPDRDRKDTLANIRSKGEFVVNLVPEELAHAMNITATNAPKGMDETQLAALDLVPSDAVEVPRIAESPVALECRLWQVIEPGGTSSIVLAKIVGVHVRKSAFSDVTRLHIDPSQMRLIGRMHGGGGYCTTKDVFNIDRRSWPVDGS